jgi:endonuclease/exonuclease/phosphatase family metal-dependent hydrolase
LSPTNRKFTWANNLRNMILAKLDRVFISTKWRATSPLARVIGLEKNVSGHVPLMLDLGGNCERAKKKFRFEKWWLERV